MTATATLMHDGATRYETDSLQEFHEAIIAAREEGAKITVLSEGNGTHVAKMLYPHEVGIEAPADGTEVTLEVEQGLPGLPEPEEVTEEEDLVGEVPPPARRTRKG